MGYTKRQFVESAYEEIGMASYAFDLGPEQTVKAMQTMDAMFAEWNAWGIRLGYPLPSNPQDSDLDEPSGVPDYANQAVITNLALRLAPKHGKTVSMDTRIAAKNGLNALLIKACRPNVLQLPAGVPAGAGNRGMTYLDPPAETLSATPNPVISTE